MFAAPLQLVGCQPIARGGEVSIPPPVTKNRGGARNSASRESHALTAGQVINLLAARSHADKIGLPINRTITIHWKKAGVRLEDMAKATGRFIGLLTKALARHGSRTAWLWVHENEGGASWHCHILVHVPADVVPIITSMQLRWLRRITNRPYRAKVIRSKPIGGLLGLEISNPELHAINLTEMLNYGLKGASPDVAEQFGMTRRKPGGLVIGKRCGTSQNIGKKARGQQ